MTTTYAAYNGKYFIWPTYGSKDCCTSLIPATFTNLDIIKKIIARNGDNGFYPILCEDLNPIRKDGKYITVSQ